MTKEIMKQIMETLSFDQKIKRALTMFEHVCLELHSGDMTVDQCIEQMDKRGLDYNELLATAKELKTISTRKKVTLHDYNEMVAYTQENNCGDYWSDFDVNDNEIFYCYQYSK